MKTARMCHLALAGTLLAGPTAAAAFVGLSIEFVENDFDLLTCRMYAQFDNPLDHMVAVAGTPESPMEIIVLESAFYEHVHGTDFPPNGNLFRMFPSLEFDTFVTIGATTLQDGMVNVAPGWPGFGPTCLGGTNLGWFVTPDDPLGVPDADGRVLLGQFSVPNSTPPAIIAGRFLMQYDLPTGETRQIYYGFCHDATGGNCFPGDLNDDYTTDVIDLLVVLGEWGTVGESPADANGDGVVDVEDLAIVFEDWDESYCTNDSAARWTGPAGPAATNTGDEPFDIRDLLASLADAPHDAGQPGHAGPAAAAPGQEQ